MELIPIVLAAILVVLPIALAVHLVRKQHRTKLDWLVSALTVAGLGGYAVADSLPGRAQVELAFPLRGGVAYVGQGGANPLLNYHNTIRAQAYAVDIVGLNAAGLHAWGLAPAELDRYAVFEWDVTSPCTGTVIEARDEFADLTPPATDLDNRSGNHVIVRCAEIEPGVDVLLAHLRQGSVAVASGASVAAGDLMGRVGNTGNTSEPHLHVHAVRTGSGTALDGEGVPISFDGRFLVRNDLVFTG